MCEKTEELNALKKKQLQAAFQRKNKEQSFNLGWLIKRNLPSTSCSKRSVGPKESKREVQTQIMDISLHPFSGYILGVGFFWGGGLFFEGSSCLGEGSNFTNPEGPEPDLILLSGGE